MISVSFRFDISKAVLTASDMATVSAKALCDFVPWWPWSILPAEINHTEFAAMPKRP